MYRRFAALAVGFALLFVSACGSKTEYLEDVLTQKASRAGSTKITVLVKYAFWINVFEKAVEKKFPEIDLVQVGNYSYNMGTDEYEARMKNDDLTDLVMTWPLDVGKQYWSERLMDLSGLASTKNYNTRSIRDIQEGTNGLYYLPGPSQVRGILYNKTMFQEKKWDVPEDYDGFVALCKEIEETGIRALQLGLSNSEVLDTAFVGYGYEKSYSSLQNASEIEKYNKGEGSFEDNYGSALDTFQRLVDDGILKPGDLSVDYAKREEMLYQRKCAMVEDSVLLARMAQEKTGDEYALMPFFNPGGTDNDWARLYPVCFIGANKHLNEEKNKAKKDLVLKLLGYIGTREGQEALAGDTGAMFSSLNGVPAPDIPEIKDLLPALNAGRYGVFPTLKNAQGALRQGLKGMVAGTTTEQQVIEAVNQENLYPPAVEPSPKVGEVSGKFTNVEMGNFITDAMRAETGCEIALFLDNGKDGLYNGKGLSGVFYPGDVTAKDISRVLPDFKFGERGVLCRAEITGQNLLSALEYSLEVGGAGGWFYYFSGLKMEFDPTAAPGSRIKKITDSAGGEIDIKKVYSVAFMDQTVSTVYLQSFTETGKTIRSVLESAVANAKPASPSGDRRFLIIKS